MSAKDRIFTVVPTKTVPLFKRRIKLIFKEVIPIVNLSIAEGKNLTVSPIMTETCSESSYNENRNTFVDPDNPDRLTLLGCATSPITGCVIGVVHDALYKDIFILPNLTFMGIEETEDLYADGIIEIEAYLLGGIPKNDDMLRSNVRSLTMSLEYCDPLVIDSYAGVEGSLETLVYDLPGLKTNAKPILITKDIVGGNIRRTIEAPSTFIKMDAKVLMGSYDVTLSLADSSGTKTISKSNPLPVFNMVTRNINHYSLNYRGIKPLNNIYIPVLF